MFYVRNEDNGVISAAVTQSYKIDKKAPTGEIKLSERNAFQTVLNKITFGLFFKEDVIVKLTSEDDASGIKSVQYYKSDSLLTDSDIGAVTDWISSTDFSIEAKDLNRFIVYVRIEDNAGNITYIGSDGATFDTTAPEIVNVADLTTYYVTKKVAVDDENLESVTLNGEPVGDVFILEGNKTASYEIKALDKAGNETVYTVYMSPISQLSDSISELTVDNVRTDNEDAVLTVEKSLVDLAESFDDGESTDDEWNQILSALKRCRELLAHINEIKSEVSEIGRIIAGEYDIGTVNSDDREDLDKLIERADSWLDGDNLTDSERAGLEEAKRSAEELIDRIEDAKDAAESESRQHYRR